VAGYRLDKWDLTHRRCKNFPPHQYIQTNFGTSQSPTMWVPGVKQPHYEADHSPWSCTWVKNAWRYKGVAMKFPKLYYCDHTCIPTGYWVDTPLEHLAQWCCHCWKHFWNFYCRVAFSAINKFFRCLHYPEIFIPLRQILFLETAKSFLEPNQRKRVGVPF